MYSINFVREVCMRLFDKQIDAQRFLLQMVPKGYFWWCSGIENNLAALEKRNVRFHEFYGCEFAPSKKSYRKKHGLANTLFFAVKLPPEIQEGGYLWYLLATDGNGTIRENSKLKDSRVNTGRITWGKDYVLYCAPRERREGGGTRWSWYLQPSVQKELDYYVGKLLKSAPFELKGFFESQVRRPMHHGVRHFLSRLLRRAHHNFTRMYPTQKWIARDPSLPLPIITGYRKQTVAAE
jgi:hypothetical protein